VELYRWNPVGFKDPNPRLRRLGRASLPVLPTRLKSETMTFPAQPEPQVLRTADGNEQSINSPLYTYAFFPQPAPELLPFIRQTEGIHRSVQVFSPAGSRIAAAVEPMQDPESLQVSDEVLVRSALRHDQVICRLFAQMPVLPPALWHLLSLSRKAGIPPAVPADGVRTSPRSHWGAGRVLSQRKGSTSAPTGATALPKRDGLSVGPQASLSPATTGPRAARAGAASPTAALAFHLACAKGGSPARRSLAALLFAHPCRVGSRRSAHPNLAGSAPPLATGLERPFAPLSLCPCLAGFSGGQVYRSQLRTPSR
jgi:hypothetical protein